MWTVFLLILMADGSELRLGFNSVSVCNEVREQYQIRPEVVSVGKCEGE